MKKLLLLVTVAFTTLVASAQNPGVAINTSGAEAHASSLLDVSGTGKGVLIPRMLMSERPSSPTTGLMIYQTDNTPGFYYYNGATWTALGGGGSSASKTYVTAHSNTSNPFTVAVILSGSNVNLFSAKLEGDIYPSGTGKFTIPTAGRYRISYSISITTPTLVSSQILINGTPEPFLTVAPTTFKNYFAASSIENLTANSTLQLQLFGLLGSVTLEPNGAIVTIEKID